MFTVLPIIIPCHIYHADDRDENSLATGGIFKILCLKWYHRSNLAMGLLINKTYLVESEGRTFLRLA